MRRFEEKWRQEKLAALEKDRLEQLKRSGDLLREAEEIRRLVQRVKEAVIVGERKIPDEDLIAWEAWAKGNADKIDPMKSGQFLSHLIPPALPEN